VSLRHCCAGTAVRVKKIDVTAAGTIVAICYRGRERQAIPILELPLPDPPPTGWEWIEAYRRWARGTLVARALMSEYQYYEFRAIDRTLTDRQMRELRAISTRAAISRRLLSNLLHVRRPEGQPPRPSGEVL
jgi:hypothetical protein